MSARRYRRLAVLILISVLPASACDDSPRPSPADAAADATDTTPGDGDSFVDGDAPEGSPFVSIDVRANPRNALSAIVTAVTSRPCSVSVAHSSPDTDERLSRRSPAGTSHEVTVVGMRPDTEYTLRPIAHCDGEAPHSGDPVPFTTGPAPDGIPPYEVIVHEAGSVQPGWTMFGPAVRNAEEPVEAPVLIAVDEAGELVWTYDGVDAIEASGFVDRDVKLLDDGNLLVLVPDGLRIVTLGGETVHELTAEMAGVGSFHHDGLLLPNGNFMTLTRQGREVDIAGMGRVVLQGDAILEIEPDGTVVWEWSTFDHLDTSRLPTTLSQTPGSDGVHDWTHSNALVYLPDEQALLLSPRHQNWIVKIDRATGDVVWRLGRDGDFALTNLDPERSATWFFSQHAPEPGADGSILIYDNGNDRIPQDAPRYSRAIIYAIDEANRRADVVWQYRTPHYTNFLGDADRLENGNVLVCAGGQTDERLPAQIIEVTGDTPPAVVWELSGTGFVVYRATRVPHKWLEGD